MSTLCSLLVYNITFWASMHADLIYPKDVQSQYLWNIFDGTVSACAAYS